MTIPTTNDTGHLKIFNHPVFREMMRLRLRMTFFLTGIMLVVFCLYFGLLGYRPDIMAVRPIADSQITLGFWFTFFIAIFSVLISGFYIWWANNKFDVLKQKLLDGLKTDG